VEDYAIHNPVASKTMEQTKLNLDRATIETLWSENEIHLGLDQSLVIAMEDEARWMIANNLTAEKQVPNFNNYIYEDALKAMKPEAVNIIR
jgi:NitT/TauT family transport system substrate-binding protein